MHTRRNLFHTHTHKPIMHMQVDLELVAQLSNLGFETDAVYMALHQARNDEAAALELLTAHEQLQPLSSQPGANMRHSPPATASASTADRVADGAVGRDDEDYEIIERPHD